jgi:hypothetical protein
MVSQAFFNRLAGIYWSPEAVDELRVWGGILFWTSPLCLAPGEPLSRHPLSRHRATIKKLVTLFSQSCGSPAERFLVETSRNKYGNQYLPK